MIISIINHYIYIYLSLLYKNKTLVDNSLDFPAAIAPNNGPKTK